MANVTITDLPALSTMTDSDVIPVVNVGANVTQKITGTNLKTYFTSNVASLSVTGSVTAGNIVSAGNIAGAGDFDIDGDGTIGGNLFVTGNINFSGNVNQISGNSGSFFGNAAGVGALYAGIPVGYANVVTAVIQATSDLNDYTQINAQNLNHGATASMEFVVTGDFGTDTTDYIDLGFSSSTWNGTQTNSLGTAVAARDGFLYVQGGGGGGNLVLGTTTAGRSIKFNAGGPGSANTVAQISNTGLTMTGIISASGNVTGGNLLASDAVRATGAVISGTSVVGVTIQLNSGATGFTGSGSNDTVGGNKTTGTITIGGPSQTGTTTIGPSTASSQLFLAGGATSSGNSKVVTIGIGGLLGSTTTILVGPTSANTSGTGTFQTQGNTIVRITNTGPNALSVAGTVTGGNIVLPPVPFANLTATAGGRATINNANLVAVGNFGANVSGGGSNVVPVWSDGTNWYIG